MTKELYPFEFRARKTISHNTFLYQFVTSSKDAIENLIDFPICSCVCLSMDLSEDHTNPEVTTRYYTPLAQRTVKKLGYSDLEDQERSIFLVIKYYSDGKMSKKIFSIDPGYKVRIQGPFLMFDLKKNPLKKIGLVAGGSGIFPMLQIISAVLSSDEKVELSFIYANKTKKDILLKGLLDEYAKDPRFHVFHTLDEEELEGYGKGRISKDMIRVHLPAQHEEDMIILICGNPFMIAEISGDKKEKEVGGFLGELGYSQEQVFKF